jgi:hypothetical protein
MVECAGGEGILLVMVVVVVVVIVTGGDLRGNEGISELLILLWFTAASLSEDATEARRAKGGKVDIVY